MISITSQFIKNTTYEKKKIVVPEFLTYMPYGERVNFIIKYDKNLITQLDSA